MKLIRTLKEVSLLKATKQKQPNGVYVKSYQLIDNYNVAIANLTDEVSATIYGANIDKMLNISDALGKLFLYLLLFDFLHLCYRTQKVMLTFPLSWSCPSHPPPP